MRSALSFNFITPSITAGQSSGSVPNTSRNDLVYIGESFFIPKESSQLLMSAIAETPLSHMMSIHIRMSPIFSSRDFVSLKAFIWSMKPAMPVPFLNSFHM